MASFQRTLRLLNAPPTYYRTLTVAELEELLKDLSTADLGDYHRDEAHACAIRIWRLYRQVDPSLGGNGTLNRFSTAVGQHPGSVTRFLLGHSKRTKYNSDLLHRWCICLTQLWVSSFGGPQVDLHLRADGVIRPLLIDIDVVDDK